MLVQILESRGLKMFPNSQSRLWYIVDEFYLVRLMFVEPEFGELLLKLNGANDLSVGTCDFVREDTLERVPQLNYKMVS